jgi:hypothetical protein
MEELKLNPVTLLPDQNGQPYVRYVIGGNVLLIANSPAPPEPTPADQGGDKQS